MASFFHAYDLRGKYPSQISEAEAEKVGKAYGTFTGRKKVMVGRDGRTHAEEITSAFVRGLRSAGVDVLDAGMVPTPIVYYAMDDLGLDHAAVVTASHNPSEYTGFKFAKSGGLAMSRNAGMKEIEEIYRSEDFAEGSGSVEEIIIEEKYVNAVSNLFSVDLDVAVNYGNGVAAKTAPKLLEKIGCELKNVNMDIDGSFPNHLPAPHEESAQKALKQEMDGQDLGIIFDGDGDRAGFIIDGEYVSEDKVLSLFAEEALKRGGGKVVHGIRVSKVVPETIEGNGGEAVESRVGHTFISEMIHSDEEIVFAGELSGHYYFPYLGFPWDDGMLAACLMCQIAEDGGLEKLNDYPSYPVSPELRIDCAHERKQKVVSKISEKYSEYDISTKDGVKINFGNGWALIRPSNTEEKISVRCEAETEKDLEQILERVESDVRSLC